MLKEIKICDWAVEKAPPKDGEANACVISFRIVNISGQNFFYSACEKILDSLSTLNGFKASNIILFFGRLAVDLYEALKSAKKQQG